jgi:hypothetical protein
MSRLICAQPLIWSLANCLLARLTPLGRFAAWSGSNMPFLARYGGFPLLDFLQACLAYAASEIVFSAVSNGSRPQLLGQEEELEPGEIPGAERHKRAHRHPVALFILLVAVSSWGQPQLAHSDETFKIGCALPHGEGTLAQYLHESRLSASRGARVVLWPETAIMLSDNSAYSSLQEQVYEVAKTYGTIVGATYSSLRTASGPTQWTSTVGTSRHLWLPTQRPICYRW